MKHKYVKPQNFDISRLASLGKQSGAALIIIILILVLGAGALLIGNFERDVGHLESRNKSALVLAQAKNAILGWSLAHSSYPGMLPFPDTNFDGNSDCPSIAITNINLLGRLPWRGQTTPCPSPLNGIGPRFTDATGEVLWLAVSENLIYKNISSTYPTINSELRNISTKWICIVDSNGNKITDRAAFVVISPGRVVANQNRTGSAPSTNQYLESLVASSTNCPVETPSVQIYRSSSEVKDTAGNIILNDILSYVTIDELVKQIENRILRELKICLDNYALGLGAGTYPLALNISGSGASEFGRFDKNATWDSNCIIEASPFNDSNKLNSLGQNYWETWSDSAFYQVAPAYVPTGDKSCPQCLSLNSAGTYYAIVLLAGKMINTQSRTTPSEKQDVSNYLDGIINTNSSDYSYESKAESSIFNDQIICVDANNVCK